MQGFLFVGASRNTTRRFPRNLLDVGDLDLALRDLAGAAYLAAADTEAAIVAAVDAAEAAVDAAEAAVDVAAAVVDVAEAVVVVDTSAEAAVDAGEAAVDTLAAAEAAVARFERRGLPAPML